MKTETNIGNNIQKCRIKLGMTQEDLAKLANVKYTTLTKIESNVIKKPSVFIISKIAEALNESIENLIK